MGPIQTAANHSECMLKCEGREVRGREAQEQEEIVRDGKRGRVYTVAPRAGANNTIFVSVIL